MRHCLTGSRIAFNANSPRCRVNKSRAYSIDHRGALIEVRDLNKAIELVNTMRPNTWN